MKKISRSTADGRGVLPSLNTIGLARALSLFEGLEIISGHENFDEERHLNAEALIAFVNTRSDKMAGHLLKRGFEINAVTEPDEEHEHAIAAQEAADASFDDDLSFDDLNFEAGPSEKELELMKAPEFCED